MNKMNKISNHIKEYFVFYLYLTVMIWVINMINIRILLYKNINMVNIASLYNWTNILVLAVITKNYKKLNLNKVSMLLLLLWMIPQSRNLIQLYHAILPVSIITILVVIITIINIWWIIIYFTNIPNNENNDMALINKLIKHFVICLIVWFILMKIWGNYYLIYADSISKKSSELTKLFEQKDYSTFYLLLAGEMWVINIFLLLIDIFTIFLFYYFFTKVKRKENKRRTGCF